MRPVSEERDQIAISCVYDDAMPAEILLAVFFAETKAICGRGDQLQPHVQKL